MSWPEQDRLLTSRTDDPALFCLGPLRLARRGSSRILVCVPLERRSVKGRLRRETGPERHDRDADR